MRLIISMGKIEMWRPSSGVPGFDFLAEFLFTVVVDSKQRALSGWEQPCGRCSSQPVILGENVFPPRFNA